MAGYWHTALATVSLMATSIFAAPVSGHAAPAVSVRIERALTYDSTGLEKSTFSPGETIRYAVLVHITGGSAPLNLSWKVSNNARNIYSYREGHAFAAGYHAIYSPSVAPADSAGPYDNSVTVGFGHQHVTRHSALTILGGRVCMFHAPVSVIGQEVGHVGWAFRTTTGDRWEFGGTEFSKDNNWIRTGDWRNVLSSFKSPPTSVRGHYTEYRCLEWPKEWMDPMAAAREAKEGQARHYDLLIDNCLTRSVAIFNKYGLNLAPGEAEYPSTYFRSLPQATEGVNAPAKWGPVTGL